MIRHAVPATRFPLSILAAAGLLLALCVASLGVGMVVLSRGGGAALPPLGTRAGAALDDFGPIPTFALVDQANRPVTSDGLRGKVVVADFVYTTCQESCPLLLSRMQALQDRLRQEKLLGTRTALLSFSVDPAHDTSAVLQAYAAEHQAEPDAWRFLTGPEKYVLPLLNQGFHLGVQQVPLRTGGQDAAAGPDAYDTMHSNRFLLVDRLGHIRAYYDGLSLDPDQVLRDVRQLLR
jgi:protein SCO1/2